jgi:tetratricopeptide (TPR) repeat protein
MLLLWIAVALGAPAGAGLSAEVDQLLASGQLDRAAERCVLVLRDQEKALGSKHPAVGQTLLLLARVQRARGKPTVAEGMEARARAISEAVRANPALDTPVPVDPKSQDLAGITPMVSRAAQLREEGNLPAAQALLEKALQQQQNSIGPRHPQVVNTLNWLAVVLDEQGKADLANAFRKRAAAIPSVP